MIWKIAKKELLLNLITFKFAIGTILCVVLMAVFMRETDLRMPFIKNGTIKSSRLGFKNP